MTNLEAWAVKFSASPLAATLSDLESKTLYCLYRVADPATGVCTLSVRNIGRQLGFKGMKQFTVVAGAVDALTAKGVMRVVQEGSMAVPGVKDRPATRQFIF